MDVKLMHRQGASIREIARRTGLSQVTVRRIQSQKATLKCIAETAGIEIDFSTTPSTIPRPLASRPARRLSPST